MVNVKTDTFSTGMALTHSTLLLLTLIKRQVAVREGWASLDIVSIITRDGAVLFLVLVSKLGRQSAYSTC